MNLVTGPATATTVWQVFIPWKQMNQESVFTFEGIRINLIPFPEKVERISIHVGDGPIGSVDVLANTNLTGFTVVFYFSTLIRDEPKKRLVREDQPKCRNRQYNQRRTS